MDPEAKRMLDDMYALVKDNHRMLRAVRRHQILDTFGKWILWGIILVAGAYSYFVYVQPLINGLHIPGMSASQTATTTPWGKLINYFEAWK
jgi:hypothetical protein